MPTLPAEWVWPIRERKLTGRITARRTHWKDKMILQVEEECIRRHFGTGEVGETFKQWRDATFKDALMLGAMGKLT